MSSVAPVFHQPAGRRLQWACSFGSGQIQGQGQKEGSGGSECGQRRCCWVPVSHTIGQSTPVRVLLRLVAKAPVSGHGPLCGPWAAAGFRVSPFPPTQMVTWDGKRATWDVLWPQQPGLGRARARSFLWISPLGAFRLFLRCISRELEWCCRHRNAGLSWASFLWMSVCDSAWACWSAEGGPGRSPGLDSGSQHPRVCITSCDALG